MAEVEFFHYRPGNTFLHRTETAVKYLSAIILSIAIFHASPQMLIAPAILLFAVTFHLLRSTGAKASEGLLYRKGFLLLLFAVIAIRGLTIKGDPIPFIPFFSIEGLKSGAVYSIRLVLLLVEGELLLSTTDPAELHGAVYRLLRPLPFIPAGRIAAMISLSISFIPLIFDQYREIRRAYDSRLGARSPRILGKITAIALPLMESVISRAEEVASAMESRCYRDDPQVPEKTITASDWIFLILVAALSAIILLLNFRL